MIVNRKKYALSLAGSIFLLFASLFLASNVNAQSSGTGALKGTVTDSTGAVIPGVTVTVTSPATGQARTTTTGGDGSYEVGFLAPGTYTVKFENKGFKSVTAPSVTVTVTETGTLDQSLEIGAQTEIVTVEANVEAVQTTNATVGATISGRTMTDLPLASRNYTNLLSMSAGADASVTNAATPGKATQATAVNGSSQTQNNYQMDGASIVSYSGVGGVNEGGSRGAFGIPNPDTIQEFKIQTSQYDAGYGRNPGANVNVVTKTGTNDFHGTAYDYFRNTVLNSADWFAKANGAKGDSGRLLNQNQYGGTFGGPVMKDKLFFFVAYQETAQKVGISPSGAITSFFPSLPVGNRGTCPAGATALSQCDPTAQAYITALGTMYGGKQGGIVQGVPIAANGSNINPVALQLMQIKLPNGSYYIPSPPAGAGTASPGITCSAPTNSFGTTSWATESSCTATTPAIYNEHQGMGNWDYAINNKNSLSGRYFYATAPQTLPFYQGGTSVIGNVENARFTNHEASLKYTSVLSNSLVNEARFSYQRNLVDTGNANPIKASSVGMTALNGAVGFDVIPRIQIGPNFNFGTQVFGTTTNHQDGFQWADQLSWTRGKHTMRMGAELDHNNWNWNFLKGLGAGLLIVNSPADFLLGLPGCAPGTFAPAAFGGTCGAGQTNLGPFPFPNSPGNTNGTPVSDILVEPTLATRYSSNSAGNFHFYNYAFSGFFQDDWKVTPRFTVNLGVRWEYDGYPSERQGKGVNFNTNLAPLSGVPQTTAACPASPANPAPVTPCAGASLAGFTVPSNYSTAAFGAIPAGVLQRNFTSMGEVKTPWDDFAPRAGFAWQPLSSSKLVVRGGAGYFYDLISGELYVHGVLQSEPFAETLGGAAGGIYFATLQQPYASTPANWTPRYVTASGLSSGIVQPLLLPTLPVPLTYQWNFNTQYEFLRSWVLELGYVGSRGIHQTRQDSIPVNPALLVPAAITGAAPVAGNAALRAVLLGLSSSTQGTGNNTDTKYNGFQATVRKTFSAGLSLQATYGWSRALASNWEGNSLIRGTTSNPTWLLPPVLTEYGLNTEYHPQRFTLNYSYELPSGHMQGLLGTLTSNWRVSGETTIQDGSPINITDGGNIGNIFGMSGGSPIPVSAQYLPGMGNANTASAGSTQSRAINGWFNAAAFCPSTATANPCRNAYAISDGFGFGNAGQGNILGPPQDNWDISLSKTTRVGGIRDGATLEFRTEFFNAFNHPQFSNPGSSDVTNAGFGKISSLSVNPRLIQFALKYSF